MRTDLVSLRGDPLASIAHAGLIERVVLGDVMYRPEELLGQAGGSTQAP